MINKFKFNEKFFNEKIKEGYMILSTSVDHVEKTNAKAMINFFESYLGKQSSNSCYNTYNYEELNKALNHMLKVGNLSSWLMIEEIYNSSLASVFLEGNTNELPKSNYIMMEKIKDFFYTIDHESYLILDSILNNDKSLINIERESIFKQFIRSKNGEQQSEYFGRCFKCDYLNTPFINIQCAGDIKYAVTIHEIKHAVDYLKYEHKINKSLIELGPILYEILFIDELIKGKDIADLYGLRLNNNQLLMKSIAPVAQILLNFKKSGSVVNSKNISEIFQSDDKMQIIQYIKEIVNNKYIKEFKYITSFLMALKLRECYYNSDNVNIEKILEQIYTVKEIRMSSEELNNSYRKYIKEIRRLY